LALTIFERGTDERMLHPLHPRHNAQERFSWPYPWKISTEARTAIAGS
jgi:hypothetical protein